MNMSDESYLWMAAIIGGPIVLLLIIDFAFRSKPSFLKGWISACFIALTWFTGIGLLFHRLS